MNSEKRKREKHIVRLMINLYCNGVHKPGTAELCPECEELARYADARVDHCPRMEDKTFCSVCPSHCYKPEMREKIRAVMRWSGPRMIWYHPVLAVKHLIETRRMKK